MADVIGAAMIVPVWSAFGAVAALVCALALGLVLRFVVHAGAAGRRSRPPRR